MTFEPFHCTFVGDTNGFEVNPAEGTLARRGGEATTLDVSYLGSVSRLLPPAARVPAGGVLYGSALATL